MASTLRLVESRETKGPTEKRSRTSDDLPVACSEATSGGAKARIKFESLPTALRAVVSDASDIGITIEAELPWLSVGTALHADCPNGVEYTARVHSFDLDVSGSGAARLRIFAALAAPDQALAPPPERRPRQRTRSRLRRLLSFGVLAVTAALLCSGAG